MVTELPVWELFLIGIIVIFATPIVAYLTFRSMYETCNGCDNLHCDVCEDKQNKEE